MAIDTKVRCRLQERERPAAGGDRQAQGRCDLRQIAAVEALQCQGAADQRAVGLGQGNRQGCGEQLVAAHLNVFQGDQLPGAPGALALNLQGKPRGLAQRSRNPKRKGGLPAGFYPDLAQRVAPVGSLEGKTPALDFKPRHPPFRGLERFPGGQRLAGRLELQRGAGQVQAVDAAPHQAGKRKIDFGARQQQAVLALAVEGKVEEGENAVLQGDAADADLG
ncbi:MAG: hypothetical protein U5J82_11045 [Desulfobacterales bacterium]|nr:hypothetical protein [Desulfobacterales bacterium]